MFRDEFVFRQASGEVDAEEEEKEEEEGEDFWKNGFEVRRNQIGQLSVQKGP